MKLVFAKDAAELLESSLAVTNDTDVTTLALDGVSRISLHFPKFSDGRAYSQAQHLRTRLKFEGELLATGDVLIDQLPHMQRLGFSHAVLRNDQSLDAAKRALARFNAFYQGDVLQTAPLFARTKVAA